MAERRRLPVVNQPRSEGSTPEPEGEEARPPWHWVGFGAVAIFAVWLPLAYVAASVARRTMTERFGADASKESVDAALAAMSTAERAKLMGTIALPSILALALAAFAGGVLVGRFGSGKSARAAAGAGAVTAFVATVMAWGGLSAQAVAGALVTFAVAIGFAAWGGRVGASRRANAKGRAAPEVD